MKATQHSAVILFAMIAILMVMRFNLPAQNVPGAFNYQGQLLDSGGQPVTTQVTITFTLSGTQ